MIELLGFACDKLQQVTHSVDRLGYGMETNPVIKGAAIRLRSGTTFSTKVR